MRNVDPEKCKPEHSGGELGLQGLVATACHTPGSVIEKLMSSRILWALEMRLGREFQSQGQRQRVHNRTFSKFCY